jgi:hypothetical protein
MRGRLVRHGFGADRAFRWRGGEISRLEGLSDAVFAFAVCFGILFWVWYDHYRFFRRYGLDDGFTTTLTGVLLFIVLFYVYPMKFLFSTLFDQLFGEAPANAIEPRHVPLLMLVYGAGFIAVQLVFILLYLHAYGLANSLELDTYERLTTRAEIQGFGLNLAVGLASIANPHPPGRSHHPGSDRVVTSWPTSAPPVDVRPMADGQHVDPVARVVDPVHDPVVPSVRAVPAFELEPEWPPDAARVTSQRTVDELDDRRGHLVRQTAQGPPAGAAQWTSNGAPPSAVTARSRPGPPVRQAGGGAGGDVGVGLGNGRHQSGIAQDRGGLLERLQVLEAQHDGGRTAMLGDDHAAMLTLEALRHLREAVLASSRA